MEKKLFEIEFQKVWNKWAWRVTKCNLLLKDNSFFINGYVNLLLNVGYNQDEYIIFLNRDSEGIGEFQLIDDEEKEQIETLVDKINEIFEIEKGWRAEEDEEYFYIGSGGQVWSTDETFSEEDEDNYELGNYFKTYKEAKKVIDSKEWQEFWKKVRNGEIGGEND